jgi:hypothetical protein
MKRYDDYRQQVPATKPHDGFFFEPVTHGDRAGERVRRPASGSPLLHSASSGVPRPRKDVK